MKILAYELIEYLGHGLPRQIHQFTVEASPAEREALVDWCFAEGLDCHISAADWRSGTVRVRTAVKKLAMRFSVAWREPETPVWTWDVPQDPIAALAAQLVQGGQPKGRDD